MARYERLFPALASIPGVESVSATVGWPRGMYLANGSFAVEGRHVFAPGQDLPYANFRLASPGYFKTMGIPLKRGRDFTDRDSYDAPFVVIVSEALVREVAALGLPVIFETGGNGIASTFVDATSRVGHPVEFVCATQDGWATLGWPT